MIDRDLNAPVGRHRLRLALRNPGHLTGGELLDLGGLACYFGKLLTVERTTLEPETLEEDSRIGRRCLGKVRHEFELIDGHLLKTRIPLAEGIEERLRMEQVVESNWLLEKRLSLTPLDPFHQSKTFAVGNTHPRARVLRSTPLLLPGLGHLVRHQLRGLTLCLRG